MHWTPQVSALLKSHLPQLWRCSLFNFIFACGGVFQINCSARLLLVGWPVCARLRMGKFKAGAFFWKYIKSRDVVWALKARRFRGFSENDGGSLVPLSLSCWLCGGIRALFCFKEDSALFFRKMYHVYLHYSVFNLRGENPPIKHCYRGND